jgi:hypothetical protein
MNLLNRYLQAVARLLPKPRRDDIIAELRANIMSQFEDREEELGRPLTEDEEAEILRHHGNPTLVAGRYREGNLGLAFGVQLIGPELFPFYRNVLILNLSITLLILFPVFLIGRGVFPSIFFPLVMQVTIITLIFSLLNRYKVFDKWDPRKLPALKANADDGPTAANIFTFIVTAIATLWIAFIPSWPYLLLGPGALYVPQLGLKAMPSWPLFYWAIVAGMCARLVLQFFVIFRWLARPKARIADAILKGLSLCLAVLLLLKAPNYVTSPNPDMASWANLTFEVSVIVWTAINLWETGRALFSLLRERHQMLPARQY